MTKRDLVIEIATEIGMIQRNVDKVVQLTLDWLSDKLSKGGSIELRNFTWLTIISRA